MLAMVIREEIEDDRNWTPKDPMHVCGDYEGFRRGVALNMSC